MSKSITVEVNPEVLKWLRESSGWKLEEVSKKLKISVEAIQDFEAGKKSPTLRQLKILSEKYKRPLASFLLSKPKEIKPLPKDYRMLTDRQDVFDKKTIFTIRKARSLQNISNELSFNIKYETRPKIEKIEVSDKPEVIASKYREIFNLDAEKQRKFKNAYQLFSYLRDTLEDMNILSFQFSMTIGDARGFALADESPAVIVVNSADSIEARIFTLMHEFSHILLGETVIDLPELSPVVKDNVERWCNEFASSFLLPKETAASLFEKDSVNLTESKILNTLSRKYKVSKRMLLLKMLKLGHISRTEHDNVLKRYLPEEKKIRVKREGKRIGMTSDKKCLSEIGNKFVSIVANNFDKNFITFSDALSYLSIKSKNFEKVLAKARK